MREVDKLTIDIQLFAEEKTEKATPKKRRDAREKGQVVRSVEITTAVVILVAFYIMKIFASSIVSRLQQLYIGFIDIDGPIDNFFTYRGLQNILIDTAIKMLVIILPILAGCLLSALVMNYVQVGFLFVTKPLEPDLNRINPIQGFKRLFSGRSIYELLKSLLKLGIILGVVYDILIESLDSMPMLLNMQVNNAFGYICNQVFRIATKSGFALLAMSIFDYIYQWWEHEKSIRMTKQEIKEEYKQMEGDPQVRARIRELQRQFSMSRMMQDIVKADVVIMNPTHYAVALEYNPEKNDAPSVLAKGQGYVALKIKDRAREHSIAIVEDKPLAQALYNTTEIGDVIPHDLYHAVAEVLAYVYNLRDETR